MGIGNLQPIKQFKTSARVGMATGGGGAGPSTQNVAGSGVPVRPGTAGGNTNAGMTA
jgi:hypothetical protein